MSEVTHGPATAIGPGGAPMSRDDLPPPTLKRWITRRKAEVVTAVRAGLIGLDEACARYDITVEEFLSWQRLLEDHGLKGLRVTRLQDYRDCDSAAAPAGATVEDRRAARKIRRPGVAIGESSPRYWEDTPGPRAA
jgi:hypothetical protein